VDYRRALARLRVPGYPSGLSLGILFGSDHAASFLRGGEQSVMQLKMSTRTLDGAMIVDCSGRLVFGEESASLRETVKKVLGESKKVVLNLHEVNYIDSGGLGTLVSIFTTARNSGGTIKLASLSQRVGDLLQLTKLVTIFEIFDDEEAAARSFS
jgi:anti-sigma B factor antagonist